MEAIRDNSISDLAGEGTATQRAGVEPLPGGGFEPEESLQLEDLWGSSTGLGHVRGKKKRSVAIEGDLVATSSSRNGAGTITTKVSSPEGNLGKRRSRKAATYRTSHQSVDTLATTASTAPDGSEALGSVRVSKLSSGSPLSISISGRNHDISFVNEGNASSVSSMNSASQPLGDSMDMKQSASLLGECSDHAEEEDVKRADITPLDVVTPPVPKPITDTKADEGLKGKSVPYLGGVADSRSSDERARRQRSLALDEDDGQQSRNDVIPDIPLLRQISIQDRLWSSYTSIYDSDDEDFLPHPFANGYEHPDMTSVEALDRMNASMKDFSTTQDDIFQFLLPSSEEDDDDSSTSSSGQTDSPENEAVEEDPNETLDPPLVESEVLEKLDKKVVTPHRGGLKNGPERMKRKLAQNGISPTAIYRMKIRIRSRRRRQITILRTAIALKNAVREASETNNGESRNQELQSDGNTDKREGNIDEKGDVTERVLISSLTREAIPGFAKAAEISPTSVSDEDEGDSATQAAMLDAIQLDQSPHEIDPPKETDEDTFRTSNKRSIFRDGNHDLDLLKTLGLSLPLSTDTPMVSNLRDGISGRKSRERKRSSSPVQHRLPRRLTPSPTRPGRGTHFHKGHQKTSFGNYFPMSRSCPSSPTVTSGEPKVRTRRVQFIGLSKPPDSGPMPVDRWLSAEDEKKKQAFEPLDTTHHSSFASTVSSDTRALPPKRKKSIEILELTPDESTSSFGQDQPSLSRRTSIGSDIAAAPPERKNSPVKLIPDVDDLLSGSFGSPLTPKRFDGDDDGEDTSSNEEGWEVKPLREVDSLLAAALSRLSNAVTKAQIDPIATNGIAKVAAHSDHFSEEASEGKSSVQPKTPIRLDSIESDQSSLDLAPYKPPIPDPSGATEEYFSTSRVLDAAVILSDAGSISTHSASTRSSHGTTDIEMTPLSTREHDSPSSIAKASKPVLGIHASVKPVKPSKAIKYPGTQYTVSSNSNLAGDSRARSGLPPSGRQSVASARSNILPVPPRGRSSTSQKRSSISKESKQEVKSLQSTDMVPMEQNAHRSARSKSAASRTKKSSGKSLSPTRIRGSSIDTTFRHNKHFREADADRQNPSTRSSALSRSPRPSSKSKSSNPKRCRTDSSKSKSPSRSNQVSSPRSHCGSQSESPSKSRSSQKRSMTDSQGMRTIRDTKKTEARSSSVSRSYDAVTQQREAQMEKLTPERLRRIVKELPFDS